VHVNLSVNLYLRSFTRLVLLINRLRILISQPRLGPFPGVSLGIDQPRWKKRLLDPDTAPILCERYFGVAAEIGTSIVTAS